MLSITVMLLNKDRVSARELAGKFEVSVRTIYRDIDAINLAGIPVISYPGNNGGFGIMENYKIDRQLLSMTDMVAILSALKGINAALDNREIDNAIHKISSLVPKEKSGELSRQSEQIVIDILPWGYRQKDKDKLRLINKTIWQCSFLTFDYKNTKGETIARTAEPMTLIFKGYTWYLFGYCCIKKDYRLFRLSRMSNLQRMERQFSRREARYNDFIGPGDNHIKPVHLLLKFSPKVASRVEDYFDPEHIAAQSNGDLLVKVSLPDDEWVTSLILGYGEHVEVMEPLHIREKIAEKIEKILAIYKPDIEVSQG